MAKELNDYKLSSAQAAEILSVSHKYFQNQWREMAKNSGLPMPKKQNRKSWAWSISQIKDYQANL